MGERDHGRYLPRMCKVEAPADLVDSHGRSIVPELVSWRGQCWRQKPRDGWREILAYCLGGSWLNVAAAIGSAQAAGAARQDGTPFDPSADPASSLVRLIQDYRLDEFVESDLDKAIAGELVFSLWVRRRDAHPWNRAYVTGVPGFFDHHIAFGAEDHNRSLDGFFRDGGDAGYVSRWRARAISEGEVPTTGGERRLEPTEFAIHRVRSLDALDAHMEAAANRIARFGQIELVALALRSGAPEPDSVAQFLAMTRDELPKAVQRLRRILYIS